MRIVFTGGGTGGHFYPLMAVADAIYEQSKQQQLVSAPELYFLSVDPYDQEALDKRDISFRRISSGKYRTYFSWRNILSYFQIFFGSLKALWTVFAIYPDVVFAKGGYASLPVLIAARILRIPVVLHESDSVPGRVNQWASSFARNIAISFPQASSYFPKEKTAVTGNPVRKNVEQPAMSGAREYLGIPEEMPVVFVLGGSQGAEALNNVIVSALPGILEDYCIIHQTGADHIEGIRQTTDVIFSNLPRDNRSIAERYKAFGFLDDEAMRMAAGAADVVVSRAGSTIFEIAAWAVPSILVPLEIAHGNHQLENAYTYARAGAATIIEEDNLNDDILISEIKDITEDEEKYESMVAAANEFYRSDSATVIARELIHICKQHT